MKLEKLASAIATSSLLVIYVNMDDANSWKYTLAKEMKASGYY